MTDRKCGRLDDCRVISSSGDITCMYYHPVFDGHGNNLNPDGNVFSWEESCSTCGRTWRCSRQFGETTRVEEGAPT